MINGKVFFFIGVLAIISFVSHGLSPEMLSDLQRISQNLSEKYVELKQVSKEKIGSLIGKDRQDYFGDLYEDYVEIFSTGLKKKAAGLYHMAREKVDFEIGVIKDGCRGSVNQLVTITDNLFDKYDPRDDVAKLDQKKLTLQTIWQGKWTGQVDSYGEELPAVALGYDISYSDDQRWHVDYIHPELTNSLVSFEVLKITEEIFAFREIFHNVYQGYLPYTAEITLETGGEQAMGHYTAHYDRQTLYGSVSLERMAAAPMVIVVHGIGGGQREEGWADEINKVWKAENFCEVTFQYDGRDKILSFSDFLPQAKHWSVSVGRQIQDHRMKNPAAPVILVAHSWGTVTTTMALNGFTWFQYSDDGENMSGYSVRPIPFALKFDHYITLGSPLGYFVYDGLTSGVRDLSASTLDFAFNQDRPPNVAHWMNFYDETDPVSLAAGSMTGPLSGDNRLVDTGRIGVSAHTAIWTCPSVNDYIDYLLKKLAPKEPPGNLGFLAKSLGLPSESTVGNNGPVPLPPDEGALWNVQTLPDVPEPDHLSDPELIADWKGLYRNLKMAESALVQENSTNSVIHYYGVEILSSNLQRHIDLENDFYLGEIFNTTRHREKEFYAYLEVLKWSDDQAMIKLVERFDEFEAVNRLESDMVSFLRQLQSRIVEYKKIGKDMPEDKAEAILRDLNTTLWNYQLEFNSFGLPRDLYTKLPEIQKELKLLEPMFQN